MDEPLLMSLELLHFPINHTSTDVSYIRLITFASDRQYRIDIGVPESSATLGGEGKPRVPSSTSSVVLFLWLQHSQ